MGGREGDVRVWAAAVSCALPAVPLSLGQWGL